MKKSALLALACAALTSAAAYAQAAPEITYVEDPAQGYTFNRFKDNWFITAEGGVNVIFGKTDNAASFGDRIAPAFGLQVGKWFSPLLGFRGGLTYLGQKGAANTTHNVWGLVGQDGGGYKMVGENKDYYATHVGQLGINFDVMLNITNWWCGYKPNRVYNFIAYVGGAGYFGFQHKLTPTLANDGWDKHFDTSLGLRGGIINSFNVSKQVALSLDIRYTAMSANAENMAYNRIANNVAAFIGVTYLFNQRTWTAPIVPVIPAIPDCNALVVPVQQQLDAAKAQAAQLKAQLDACQNQLANQKPVVECKDYLATVYFTIGSSNVSRPDKNVLKSIAAIMKANPSTKYTVCGWADNFTGSDAINTRLRENRANAVKNILIANGVSADQLDVTTNNGDRYGEQSIYLDRCVTIQAK